MTKNIILLTGKWVVLNNGIPKLKTLIKSLTHKSEIQAPLAFCPYKN
jgi:hypothetical protein